MRRGLKMAYQPALDDGSVLLAEDRVDRDAAPARIRDDACGSLNLLLDERDGWQDEQRLLLMSSP